ncbi:hypothetical protein ABIB66_008683 [Bradyrhizobium sp. F1.13.3]
MSLSLRKYYRAQEMNCVDLLTRTAANPHQLSKLRRDTDLEQFWITDRHVNGPKGLSLVLLSVTLRGRPQRADLSS